MVTIVNVNVIVPLPNADTRAGLRARIVDVAAGLLHAGGREAVTTRAVTAAAGVQAPTLYRLFGDKAGLLDAVAAHGYTQYLARKQPPEAAADPVEALRAGWDLHVGFGLENPAMYALMYGDPRPVDTPEAADSASRFLRTHVRAIARAGRLRVAEGHAVALVRASGTGTVLTLLDTPPEQRDPALSTMAREACIAAITTAALVTPVSSAAGAATMLRASLEDVSALSPSELALLGEWLDRIAGP